MTTRRERLERKLELREEWAEKRDAKREATRGARPDTHQFLGGRTTPSQAMIASETKARAEWALGELSEDYARILHLIQVQDLMSLSVKWHQPRPTQTLHM